MEMPLPLGTLDANQSVIMVSPAPCLWVGSRNQIVMSMNAGRIAAMLEWGFCDELPVMHYVSSCFSFTQELYSDIRLHSVSICQGGHFVYLESRAFGTQSSFVCENNKVSVVIMVTCTKNNTVSHYFKPNQGRVRD